ncbi:uncharacterized protein LOC130744401 [Lotus japonicus]|uniref:uncharacterized protein LOC130744401 n=1 Tax=Lotus japonicus TaxID=34305 RepID=UPI002585C0C7|nr:uncharacterized protein LOC130744401 [Lotus japonicus]
MLVDWANGMNLAVESVPADGSMGGLVTLWKAGYFDVLNVIKNQRFLILIVRFPNITEPYLLANVYGPIRDDERGNFFAELGLHLNNFCGPIAIGGDFNATLHDSERKGSGNVSGSDQFFKLFVENYHLIDLPLRNGEFTWTTTKNGGLWSKLDRWLVNDDLILTFNGAAQSAEEWNVSDHRAVTLSVGSRDFGPKPFSFFNHWLLEEGFKDFVEEWWSSTVVEGWSSFALMQKLKGLRTKIREWRSSKGV